MKRDYSLVLLAPSAVVLGCLAITMAKPLVIHAQTLPLALTIGVNPDTSASAPMGYTVQLDAAAPVDVGLPATNPSCKAFVGSAVSACVPFSVSISTAGAHTVTIVGYNLGGSSAGTPISFTVTAPPGNPANVRVTK